MVTWILEQSSVPNTVPCFEPTCTRRTSGRCLGYFRTLNLSVSPCNINRRSASHYTPASLFFYSSLCLNFVFEDKYAVFVVHTCLHQHAPVTARTDLQWQKPPQMNVLSDIGQHWTDKYFDLCLASEAATENVWVRMKQMMLTHYCTSCSHLTLLICYTLICFGISGPVHGYQLPGGWWQTGSVSFRKFGICLPDCNAVFILDFCLEGDWLESWTVHWLYYLTASVVHFRSSR
jgi:hypothetical protein